MVKKKSAIFFDRDGTIIRSKLSKTRKPIAIKILSECKIFPSAKKIFNKQIELGVSVFKADNLNLTHRLKLFWRYGYAGEHVTHHLQRHLLGCFK